MNETVTRLIGTSNRGFAQYAQEEIRRLVPSVKFTYLVPNEIFMMELPMPESEAAAIIREQQPMFLRHLQPVQVEIERAMTAQEDVFAVIRAAEDLFHFAIGEKVAIQVRKTEETEDKRDFETNLKQSLDELLQKTFQGAVVVKEADRILSIFITKNILFIGISKPADNISDWSGGAIRFKREEGQVSRSKFKLLEAEQEFGLSFSNFRCALDIGASPGGWTSLLLERGLTVTAVDPGELHPSLTVNPRLTTIKKNASDVTFTKDAFDLLVCDMSWSPRQMAKLVVQLSDALQQGGQAIITVKLLHKKPFQTVKDVIQLLRPDFSLIRGKQLFHNREELTLHMVRNAR